MNTNKLLSVLRDVRLLKFVATDELQQFANDYPYFQQAHILLAKKYLMDNNPHFEEKLHIAAIYASDRNNLHITMLGSTENSVKQDVSINIPQELISGNTKIKDELIYASMSDTLPVQDALPEEEHYGNIATENTITEATAMEELESVSLATDAGNEKELNNTSMNDVLPLQDTELDEENHGTIAEEYTITGSIAAEEPEIVPQPSDSVNEDELSHASMSDTLPVQDAQLDEENYEAVTEENTTTEATAMEELETASQPPDAIFEDELSHASMSDALPVQDTLLDEENYDLVLEENTVTEGAAMEELEASTLPPTAKVNESAFSEGFNINQPHTFTDWLKFIQSMPRSLQHKSSAPDYQPISVPAPPKDELAEESVPIEYVPEVLVAEPEDNIEAIDEFIAQTSHNRESVKTIPVKNLADRSLEENDELLTETLAHIYEEQQLYNKAIRVYAKLSLKLPEKSVYFASLIKELKSKL